MAAAMASASTTGDHASTASTPSAAQLPSTIPGPPVELENLKPQSRTTDGAGSQGPRSDVSIPTTSPISSLFPPTSVSAMSESTPDPSSNNENTRPEASSSSNAAVVASHPEINPSEPEKATPSAAAEPISTTLATQRTDSVAIGSSTEDIQSPKAATVTSEAGPALLITLLLTNGARHPYKLDDKYLTKRNVNTPLSDTGKKDPYSITVYMLKELILREWREEWEAMPSSPSSIRLIFFGRYLVDKDLLKECRFNKESANVVHMNVKPVDEEVEGDAQKQNPRDRGGEEGTAGCRCVIL